MNEPAKKQPDPLHLFDQISRFIEEGPFEPDGEDEDGYPCEKEVDPKPQWAVVYICVDELYRRYGGPEEGGWWYDEGYPIRSWPVKVRLIQSGRRYEIPDHERAFIDDAEAEILAKYDFTTGHRYSMRPRGDDYSWRLTWDTPTPFPSTRPRYC